MSSRLTLVIAAVFLAAFFPACTVAQHHPGSPGHSSHIGPVLTGRGHAGHHARRGAFVYPYYWDDYGPESADQPEGPSVPPVNISVQQPQAPTPPPKPADSLLLEYHEGQWVRIPTGSQMPIGPQSVSLRSAPNASKNAKQAGSSASPATAPVKLPPAILVFKDGHQEQVARYVVNGKFLYTSADYWSTGSWTRKIPVAELDVSATVRANAERGSSFSLPSRPNEVVVRF